MPERDFERYLAQLRCRLRVGPRQRDAVSLELQDHLEERLRELQGQGLPREQAVRLALQEMGEAEILAAQFSQIVRIRRKRWMMRMTVGTVATAATFLFLASAFWPETPQGATPRRLMAQVGEDGHSGAPAAEAPDVVTERRLAQRLHAEFHDPATLRSVLDYLREEHGLQFFINQIALEDYGVDISEAPVNVQLTSVRTDMLLDLALGQHSLTYFVRDGIVIVTTLEDLESRLEVRVYNCRDLMKLSVAASPKGNAWDQAFADDANMMMGVDVDVVEDETPGFEALGGGSAGGQNAGTFGGFFDRNQPKGELTVLLQSSVRPDSWAGVGGPGTIAEIGGLLVVNQDPQTHRLIETVLHMLREAHGRPPGATVRPK